VVHVHDFFRVVTALLVIAAQHHLRIVVFHAVHQRAARNLEAVAIEREGKDPNDGVLARELDDRQDLIAAV
jgi:hypothetical protein